MFQHMSYYLTAMLVDVACRRTSNSSRCIKEEVQAPREEIISSALSDANYSVCGRCASQISEFCQRRLLKRSCFTRREHGAAR